MFHLKETYIASKRDLYCRCLIRHSDGIRSSATRKWRSHNTTSLPHTHMHTHTHAHTHTHTHTHAHTHTHTHTHTGAQSTTKMGCKKKPLGSGACTVLPYLSLTPTHIHTHAHTRKHMHTHAHTHARTHTQTYTTPSSRDIAYQGLCEIKRFRSLVEAHP